MTTVKDKEGHALGHLRYKDIGNNTIFIDMMENYKKVKGVVRTGVAQILKDNPDKKVYWSATSESSVKSYNKFCEEYPELAKRVEFEDIQAVEAHNNFMNSFSDELNKSTEDEKQAILDEIFSDSYNSEKGVIADETEIYNKGQSRERDGIIHTSSTDSNNANSKEVEGRRNISDEGRSNTGKQSDDISNISMAKDNRNTSSNSNQSRPKDNQSGTGRAAKQSPTDRLVNSNGNIEEISKALDDIALNLDPQTFENLADNADAYYNKLAEAGITDVTGLKEAFAQGDVNYVKFVVSKQLAAQRLISDLMEEVKLGADDIRGK